MGSVANLSAADRQDSIPKTSSLNHLFDLKSSLSSVRKTSSALNLRSSSARSMGSEKKSEPKIVSGDSGYVLEDVPHLTDYIQSLPVSCFMFCSFLAILGFVVESYEFWFI